MRLLMLMLLLLALGWLCFFSTDGTAMAADYSPVACAGGVCVAPGQVAAGRLVAHRGPPVGLVRAVAFDRSRPFMQRGPVRRLARAGVIVAGRLASAPFRCCH